MGSSKLMYIGSDSLQTFEILTESLGNLGNRFVHLSYQWVILPLCPSLLNSGVSPELSCTDDRYTIISRSKQLSQFLRFLITYLCNIQFKNELNRLQDHHCRDGKELLSFCQ